MKKVSVLVSGCDKYEECWHPFFTFFRKYWDCPYDVYLNTETKTCKEDGVISLNCGTKPLSWSKRLKKALKKIKSEYIIFLLEDFFLLDYVDQKQIEKAISIMDRDRSIAVIVFEHYDESHTSKTEYPEFNLKNLDSKYFLSCQTAIWRRKDLIRFINPHENPWQFELYGTDRAKLYNKKFLISNSQHRLPFIYDFHYKTGHGLFHGRWLKSNVELFESNNIVVDFSKLGFYEKGNIDTHLDAPKKCFKDRYMYFLYGGGEKARMSIPEQLKFATKHPRKFLFMLKCKLIYFFTDKR